MDKKQRCSWSKNKHYINYHDNHWGKPIHDDKELFKLLCLESQSSGLGFSVVWSKLNEYEKAFNFDDIKSIAQLSEPDLERIINEFNVIKNKSKITAIVKNANAYFRLIEKYSSLDYYLWQKVNFKISSNSQIIVENDLSKEIAKELKKFGFAFLGSVTIFSFLQAMGIYDDHEPSCFLFKKLQQ